MEIYYSHIEEKTEELLELKKKFLRQQDWVEKCDFPESIWKKSINERTYMTTIENAVHIEKGLIDIIRMKMSGIQHI